MTSLPDVRLFQGHFDAAPVLPGVAQIALALAACADHGMQARPLTGLRDVRFSRPIGPHDALDIVLDTSRGPESIRFEIRTGGHQAASGLLLFAPHDDACE